jgi:hypothetical protein
MPVSARTLLRNLGLLTLPVALWTLGTMPHPALPAIGGLTLGAAVMHTAMRKRRPNGANQPAPRTRAGQPAPPFEATDLGGQTRHLRELPAEDGRALVLIFISPHCQQCQKLLPQLPDWQRHLRAQARLRLASNGDPYVNALKTRAVDADVLLQRGHEIARAYGVDVTPSAVSIGPDGRYLAELAAATIASATIGRLGIARPARDVRGRQPGSGRRGAAIDGAVGRRHGLARGVARKQR